MVLGRVPLVWRQATGMLARLEDPWASQLVACRSPIEVEDGLHIRAPRDLFEAQQAGAAAS